MLTLPPIPAIVRYHDLPETDIAERWQSLTPDEQRIVQMVGRGWLNKEIAYRGGMALRTVEDRRARAMQKIGAESFVELVRFIVRAEDLKLIEESVSTN